jgi:hypothetical protein
MNLAYFVQRYKTIDGSAGKDDHDYLTHVVGDSRILALCRDYPSHTSKAEVRAKVRYVNRLYKCWMGNCRTPEGDLLKHHLLDRIEWAVADALIESRADSTIEKLSAISEFTHATLPLIVRCHAELVLMIRSAADGRCERVFCSKYASFHFPAVVPIMGSNAKKRAIQLVNELVGFPVHSYEESDKDSDYETHCGLLLMLIDHLRKHGVAKPDLKKLDHVLYWPN